MESNPHSSAREAAARLADLEREAPAALLRFYDQPLALAAMRQLLAEGQDPEQLLEAMGRMKRHPEFRTRKHPPQLQDWLRKRAFLGWLQEDPPAADPQAEGGVRTPFASPDLPAEVLAGLGDGAVPYLVGATWREADRTVLTRTDTARIEITRRISPARLTELQLRIERAPPATTSQPESGN